MAHWKGCGGVPDHVDKWVFVGLVGRCVGWCGALWRGEWKGCGTCGPVEGLCGCLGMCLKSDGLR